MELVLDFGLPPKAQIAASGGGGGLPDPPVGYAYVVDANGDYVVDANGDYVIAAI